jgi:hypothetical protein
VEKEPKSWKASEQVLHSPFVSLVGRMMQWPRVSMQNALPCGSVGGENPGGNPAHNWVQCRIARDPYEGGDK